MVLGKRLPTKTFDTLELTVCYKNNFCFRASYCFNKILGRGLRLFDVNNFSLCQVSSMCACFFIRSMLSSVIGVCV